MPATGPAASPSPDEAIVYAYDRAHHVRLLFVVRDGRLEIRGDWRHVDRETWHDAHWLIVSRYLVSPNARALSAVDNGHDGLWDAARIVGKSLNAMAEQNDLGLITGCRS